MPADTLVIETIRNGLIGALTDFVQESGFVTELNLVVELVYELAEYREEDIPFFPSVYLVKRNHGMDTLSIIAPGADRISLKSIGHTDGGGAEILKDCAALADGGWSIYVDVTDSDIKYGLFRSELLPISLSSAEHMANPTSHSGAALLLRNCAKNSVELLSSDGRRMEFGLTSSKPLGQSISSAYLTLAQELTSGVDEAIRANAAVYLRRLIALICQRCHGTIIVVIPKDETVVPKTLCDGVVLEDPIDLLAAFHELHSETTAATLARLSAREAVLRGMIQSDGITVLSSDGKVLAFRVFVKPDERELTSLDSLSVRGGARSRAFELLKLRLGNPVSCVFFRSQDGRTKCVVNR